MNSPSAFLALVFWGLHMSMEQAAASLGWLAKIAVAGCVGLFLWLVQKATGEA